MNRTQPSFKPIIAGALLTLGGLVGFAAPTYAAVAPVAGPVTNLSALQTGGSGDFYQHLSCWVGTEGANLDVTNYDIATGQRYHMDLDRGGWDVIGLYVDGVKQPAWNDVYKDFSNRASKHVIEGRWADGWDTWRCWRSL